MHAFHFFEQAYQVSKLATRTKYFADLVRPIGKAILKEVLDVSPNWQLTTFKTGLPRIFQNRRGRREKILMRMSA